MAMCSFSILDRCYLGFFTVTLVICLLFMYPDMEHPVLVHDASEIKITLHYITQGYFYQISKGGGAFEILDLFLNKFRTF